MQKVIYILISVFCIMAWAEDEPHKSEAIYFTSYATKIKFQKSLSEFGEDFDFKKMSILTFWDEIVYGEFEKWFRKEFPQFDYETSSVAAIDVREHAEIRAPQSTLLFNDKPVRKFSSEMKFELISEKRITRNSFEASEVELTLMSDEGSVIFVTKNSSVLVDLLFNNKHREMLVRPLLKIKEPFLSELREAYRSVAKKISFKDDHYLRVRFIASNGASSRYHEYGEREIREMIRLSLGEKTLVEKCADLLIN